MSGCYEKGITQHQEFLEMPYNEEFNMGYAQEFQKPCFKNCNSIELQFQHPEKNQQLIMPSTFYLYTSMAGMALRNVKSTSERPFGLLKF